MARGLLTNCPGVVHEDQIAPEVMIDTTEDTPVEGEPTRVDPVPVPPPLLPQRSHLRLISGEPAEEAFPPATAASDGDWPPLSIDSALKEILPPDESEASTPLVEVVSTPNLRLRRDESVLAEVIAERRSTLWRAAVAARRMSTRLQITATHLRDSTSGAIRRFETLPRHRQILWVAAPYVVALLLVLVLLFFSRSPDEPAAANQARSAPAQAATESPKIAGEKTKPADPPVASSDDAQPAPKATADPDPPPLRSEVRRIPVWSRLYVRPNTGYKIAAHLRPGTEVTLYPDFPTEDGWHLARSEKGTIGFIQQERLDGIRARKQARRGRRHRR